MKIKIPKIDRSRHQSVAHTRTEKDISDTITYGTFQESLDSFDLLLKKGIRTDVLKEVTQDENAVTKAFEMGAKLIGFINVDGIDRGQLKLF